MQDNRKIFYSLNRMTLEKNQPLRVQQKQAKVEKLGVVPLGISSRGELKEEEKQIIAAIDKLKEERRQALTESRIHSFEMIMHADR